MSAIIALGILHAQCLFAQTPITLENGKLKLQWTNSRQGYRLQLISLKEGKKQIALNHPLGEYTVLYTAEKPNDQPLLNLVGEKARLFPDTIYDHIYDNWKVALSAVPLNVAGEAKYFFPSSAKSEGKKLLFTKENGEFMLSAKWFLDPKYPQDIQVEILLKAKKSGYFAISTPTLATFLPAELNWGIIPGYFQGNKLAEDLVSAYAYGHGIPNRPVLVRERAASTLSPIITNNQGISLAVIPAPGQGRDPWELDKNTQKVWQLGLALMNRQGKLTPEIYHPVLGEKGSYLKKEESCTFNFRYSLTVSDWYQPYQHAVNDIYKFKDVLALKNTKQSLSDRIFAMTKYLKDDSTSMWKTYQYGNLKIGAQAYNGGIYGADNDALKNSDYGAMWMLAKVTNDSLLQKTRLPFARNFKLAQQQQQDGFFKGAAVGQYYLWKSQKFIEEWGHYVEPIGLSYYVMLDIGNILLFEPNDRELRERLKLGADRLLSWQASDGSWQVAYDKTTENPVFTDLKDLRPTFYGLIVAYRILGDEKYLTAAKKGANWFIKNAVNTGQFVGVTGDFRFIPDFATGQSVQALLDLYEITNDETYKTAAIKTARFYTTSIYTHPIPTNKPKIVNGKQLKDWEISMVGLRFEQGGLLGSANGNGPILLASHAGMFVRLFALTKDSLYLNMARTAALGQDAFVNPNTHVSSYYWNKMNAGVGRYPHHAWWQVGWIADYLLSEIELRSNGEITFPRGFITPKVGPHQTYGFANGKIFGQPASLLLREGLFVFNNPLVDYVSAIDEKQRIIYLMILNNDDEQQVADLKIDLTKLTDIQVRPQVKIIDQNEIPFVNNHSIKLAPYGLKLIRIKY